MFLRFYLFIRYILPSSQSPSGHHTADFATTETHTDEMLRLRAEILPFYRYRLNLRRKFIKKLRYEVQKNRLTVIVVLLTVKTKKKKKNQYTVSVFCARSLVERNIVMVAQSFHDKNSCRHASNVMCRRARAYEL